MVMPLKLLEGHFQFFIQLTIDWAIIKIQVAQPHLDTAGLCDRIEVPQRQQKESLVIAFSKEETRITSVRRNGLLNGTISAGRAMKMQAVNGQSVMDIS